MKDTSKNGANGTSTLNGTHTIATPAVDFKKVEPTKVEPPTLQTPTIRTLDEQRQRVDSLNALFEKEEKLLKSRTALKGFVQASDEHTNNLELMDGKGARFNTGNPQVIAKVIKLIQQELDEKVTEVQLKIINC